MNRYLKLVNFEFNRIAKVYVVLLGLILVSQIMGVIFASRRYMKNADEALNVDMLSKSEFLSMFGHMEFQNVIESFWFYAPIVLSIVAVIFYIFIIWYRDWFGKNTFAYRLLTLPTARLNVFYAKLTTIMVMTLGFIAFQYIIYPLERFIMQIMVPSHFRIDASFHEVIRYLLDLGFLYPDEPLQFIFRYGGGLIVVAVIFTAILFERSFRWKGIILGVIYGVVSLGVVLLPLILQGTILANYLYPSEVLMVTVLASLIVLAGSIGMSGYLLNKKIQI